MNHTDQEISHHVERVAAAMPECGIQCERKRYPAEIVQITPIGPRYIQLTIRVSETFASKYCRPGQYVTLSTGALEPRFFVIASAPERSLNAHKLDFLLDADSEAGQSLGNLSIGSRLLVSEPEGAGYPADDVVGKHVLLFTTGSGIATMRGVLNYWAAHATNRPLSIVLFYGESTRADFAYIEEIEQWRRNGVRVYLTEDQRAEGEVGHRYVQDAFDEDRPALHDTVVFLSGAGIMMRIVSEKLLRLGLEPEHLYTNI